MKTYNSINDINQDLKRLKLERQIALEEMKGLKYELKKDFGAYHWLGTALSAIGQYGILYFIRKLFR